MATEFLKILGTNSNVKVTDGKLHIVLNTTGYPQVENWSALPDPTTVPDSIYNCLHSQGVWPFTYKSSGLWYSNGTSWEKQNAKVFTFNDTNFTVFNSSDNTKQIGFDVSTEPTGTKTIYNLKSMLEDIQDEQNFAIHTNTANEISTLTEKTSGVEDDLLVIEDQDDSGAKKKIVLKNIYQNGITFTPVGSIDGESVTGYWDKLNIKSNEGIDMAGGQYVYVTSTSNLNLAGNGGLNNYYKTIYMIRNNNTSSTLLEFSNDAGKHLIKGNNSSITFNDGAKDLDFNIKGLAGNVFNFDAGNDSFYISGTDFWVDVEGVADITTVSYINIHSGDKITLTSATGKEIENKGVTHFFKGIIKPITTKTADYTATLDDHTILCNDSNMMITLPTAVGNEGLVYNIKLIATLGWGDSVTVETYGSETIDGDSYYDFGSQYDAITLQSDGSNWWLI